MSQKLIIGIGPRLSVEVERNDSKELIVQASFWSSLPDACQVCGATLELFHRETSNGDDYYGMKCTGEPPHQSNFGIYKDKNKGLFYKGERSWEDWIVGRSTEQQQQPQQQANGGREPQAEKDRLITKLNEAWDSQPRTVTLSAAIAKRFSNKTIEDLTITELRNVLESLTGPATK
jgi:hypothetical protein